MINIDYQLIPVYLNSRNIGEDSIIINNRNSYSSSNIPTVSLSNLIGTLPEDTVNKISFNIDDCIIYQRVV